MKAKELKKLITPKYFYSKNGISDNKSLKTLKKGFRWNNLPDNLYAHFNKDFKIRKFKKFNKNNYKNALALKVDEDFHTWLNYKQLTKINKKYTFIQYKKLNRIAKRKNELRSISKRFNKFNQEFNKKKRFLWIFQKMFIFFKIIETKVKKDNRSLNLKKIFSGYLKIKMLYKYIILILIKFFNSFIYKFYYYKKIKWVSYIKNVKVKLSLYFFFLLNHFKKIKRKILKKAKLNKILKKKKGNKIFLKKKKEKQPVKTTAYVSEFNTTNLILDNNIYEQNLKNMDAWMTSMDEKPWLTFRDNRAFQIKKNFFLNQNFNKNEKKRLVDWLLNIEKKFKDARIAYKNEKRKEAKNYNIRKW